jgi:hypothetical protein
LSLATVVAPTALSLIGCRILCAVSGILRTQCGRRGSGTRETSFIHLAPLRLGSPLSPTDSLTPGRRRRSAFLPRALGGLLGGARHHVGSNRAPASLPSLSARSGRRAWAGGDRGWPPARHVLSLTWPASAVSHLPMAMDVLPGPLAGVPDQTRPHRRCRCHRRAAGGKPGLARSAGGNPGASCSWRVWCRGTVLRSCVISWAAAGVADRQRHAASPVPGSPD